MGISKNLFSIPTSVSKYLTYALVLHIIALALAAIALIMALLGMIPGFNMMCFPTCMASFAGSVALIAFIFDLAIFYISKAAIDKVNGASASIGAAVWMTLAAWFCCAFAGCAFGMANCCCGGCGTDRDNHREKRRNRRNKKDREADADSFDDYRRDQDMRMHAIRDEERRKYQQDLPSFQPYEREPLNPTPEDKYLYDDTPVPYQGTGVQGVGMGYGRRNGAPNPYAQAAGAGVAGGYAGGYGQTLGVQRAPSSGSSMLTAGNAGVGAGGDGVDPRPDHNYGTEQMQDNCESRGRSNADTQTMTRTHTTPTSTGTSTPKPPGSQRTHPWQQPP